MGSIGIALVYLCLSLCVLGNFVSGLRPRGALRGWKGAGVSKVVSNLQMFKGLGDLFKDNKVMKRPDVGGLDIEKLERSTTDCLIVGAGLSGLSCALDLHKKGKMSTILEASDRAGGRIQTDLHPKGYLLDRGFQVFIEEYPEELGGYIHDNLIDILMNPVTQPAKHLCVGETMATLKPVE